jgi:hypothetical protein
MDKRQSSASYAAIEKKSTRRTMEIRVVTVFTEQELSNGSLSRLKAVGL